MMPQFTLSFPVLGNIWVVGLAFQTHLVFVAFIAGISIMAPIAEALGARGQNARWERLAHELAGITTGFFSFAATWAVLGLVLLFGLYPRLFGFLTSIFFGPLLLVAIVWFVMTISAYVYYYSWRRLSEQRGLHIAIGATFALATFIFISTITELSSYQLTPTESTGLPAAAFNPSWLPEVVHRHVGNLSYAGIILAAYAGTRSLFARGSPADLAYYDWLGEVGLFVGLGLAILQPIVGWFYAQQILVASPVAYVRMMVGENSWLFLLQTFFLGTMFYLGNLYLALAVQRGRPGPSVARWLKTSLWLIAVLALLGIVPKEWPLGQMTPWKYLSLAGLVILTIVNLVLYLRSRGDFVWGKAGWGSHAALMFLGVVIVLLIVTMGIIRTSARGTDPIYRKLGPTQSQQLDEQ